MGPVRFPVVVINCPAGKIQKTLDCGSKFQSIEEWTDLTLEDAMQGLRMPKEIAEDGLQALKELLGKHNATFASKITKLGRCTMGTHKNRMSQPVKQKAYRHAKIEFDFIKDSMEKLLEQGLIDESDSPWASPLVVVKKKEVDGLRMCVDQRAVNELEKEDAYPMPETEVLISQTGGAFQNTGI